MNKKSRKIKIILCSSAVLPALSLASCSSKKEETLSKVKWIGHRGAPGKRADRSLTPSVFENTKESFETAAKYTGNDSYWGIETDVHPTKDGDFVCVHDTYCFRDTDGWRDNETNIHNLTLTEAKSKDLLYSANYPAFLCDGDFDPQPQSSETSNYKICSLDEYLKICKDYNKTAVIEIKQDGDNMDFDHPETDTGSVWNTTNLPKLHKKVTESGVNYCYISFDIAAINWMCTPTSSNGLGISKENVQMLYNPISSYGYDWNDPQWYIDNGYSIDVGDGESPTTAYIGGIYVTKELVDKFHAKNLKFNVWTVDSLPRYKSLEAAGVDFITSDFARSTLPDEFLE